MEQQTWTKHDIDTFFTEARDENKSPGDVVGDLHIAVYGSDTWRTISHLDDYVKCGSELGRYLMSKCIEHDKLHRINTSCMPVSPRLVTEPTLPGGLWFNYGFSIDDNLPPWAVLPSSYTTFDENNEGDSIE